MNLFVSGASTSDNSQLSTGPALKTISPTAWRLPSSRFPNAVPPSWIQLSLCRPSSHLCDWIQFLVGGRCPPPRRWRCGQPEWPRRSRRRGVSVLGDLWACGHYLIGWLGGEAPRLGQIVARARGKSEPVDDFLMICNHLFLLFFSKSNGHKFKLRHYPRITYEQIRHRCGRGV
jgi:hypothetical protein